MDQQLERRIDALIAAAPNSIEGQNGSGALYGVCVSFTRGYALTPEEALPWARKYNALKADVPWSDAEILAKLKHAREHGQMEMGKYFQQDDRRHTRTNPPPPPSPQPPPDDSATHRANWSLFAPSQADMDTIARLRGVNPSCVQWMVEDGWIHVSVMHDKRVFVIRDGPEGHYAQARALDGSKLPASGGASKARCLRGSRGKWLNYGGMMDADTPVIIAEGSISSLEIVEAIRRAEDYRWAAKYLSPEESIPAVKIVNLVAHSAGSRLTPDMLQELRGRRVRIFPDEGAAGADFAASNTALLRSVGCVVDAIKPPEGTKDLGDCLRQIPATDVFWNQLLTL